MAESNSVVPACEWIRPLATPYLRGYRAVPTRRGSLRGYWFLHPESQTAPSSLATPSSNDSKAVAAGFYVGYLIGSSGFEFFAPQPPECMVYVFVHPTGHEFHRRLVADSGSLVRRTFDYIRLLTHRPPRFAFYEADRAAMVRHQPMREWPREKYKHFSRNFLIETLAWLVRSGLVRKVLAESLPKGETRRTKRSTRTKSGAKKRPR